MLKRNVFIGPPHVLFQFGLKGAPSLSDIALEILPPNSSFGWPVPSTVPPDPRVEDDM